MRLEEDVWRKQYGEKDLDYLTLGLLDVRCYTNTKRDAEDRIS